MVDIHIEYPGALRSIAEHGPSHTRIQTDAPRDNHGRGESFSPTDLLATSLGTCMVTTMGILANKKGWVIDGIEVHVRKQMSASPPRRVARLPTELRIPAERAAALDSEARAELENAAHTCPVRLSLADSIEVPVTFHWG